MLWCTEPLIEHSIVLAKIAALTGCRDIFNIVSPASAKRHDVIERQVVLVETISAKFWQRQQFRCGHHSPIVELMRPAGVFPGPVIFGCVRESVRSARLDRLGPVFVAKFTTNQRCTDLGARLGADDMAHHCCTDIGAMLEAVFVANSRCTYSGPVFNAKFVALHRIVISYHRCTALGPDLRTSQRGTQIDHDLWATNMTIGMTLPANFYFHLIHEFPVLLL